MPITFNCPCGKILSSRECDAGLKAICPGCGRRVIVPGQIQTPPETKDQLRTAALKVDSWIHSHQQAFWLASAFLAVLFVVGLVGFKFWSDNQRRQIAEKNLANYVPPVEIKLDPNADPELWRTSFDSFAVALRQSIANNELLQSKFTGHKVVWEVTFDEVLQQNALYFQEAEALREGDRGVLTWASVLPSQIKNAEKLVRGQRIRLSGKIGPVLLGRSAEHPMGNFTVRPLECTVEPISESPAMSEPPPAPARADEAK